jgi:hypothetical protein
MSYFLGPPVIVYHDKCRAHRQSALFAILSRIPPASSLRAQSGQMPCVTRASGISFVFNPDLTQAPLPFRSLPHQAQRQRVRLRTLALLLIVISSLRPRIFFPRTTCVFHAALLSGSL